MSNQLINDIKDDITHSLDHLKDNGHIDSETYNDMGGFILQSIDKAYKLGNIHGTTNREKTLNMLEKVLDYDEALCIATILLECDVSKIGPIKNRRNIHEENAQYIKGDNEVTKKMYDNLK